MKTIIAALGLVLTTFAASAHEASIPSPASTSSKTRAAVRADVLNAVARGDRLSFGEVGRPYRPFTSSQLSRDDVRTELFAAMARGEQFTYGNANPPAFVDGQANRLQAAASSLPSDTPSLRMK